MKERVVFFNSAAIWIGIIAAALCLWGQTILGSPFQSLHILKGSELLPPIWIFNILSIITNFLIGLAAGGVINATASRLNNGEHEISAYKGGFFFISCFFLSFIRYYLLFFATRLFLALVISMSAFLCSVICALFWRRVRPALSAAVMFLFAVWQFYILFVNLSIFLHN